MYNRIILLSFCRDICQYVCVCTDAVCMNRVLCIHKERIKSLPRRLRMVSLNFIIEMNCGKYKFIVWLIRIRIVILLDFYFYVCMCVCVWVLSYPIWSNALNGKKFWNWKEIIYLQRMRKYTFLWKKRRKRQSSIRSKLIYNVQIRKNSLNRPTERTECLSLTCIFYQFPYYM